MKKFVRILCLSFCLLMLTTQLVSAASVVQPSVKWSTYRQYKVNIQDPNSTLNCRSGPGTSYDIIGYLYSYDYIVCDGSNSDGTWYHITDDGIAQNQAWVSASYVKFVQYVN